MTIVGIDLGTTLSAVALFLDGEVHLLPNNLGDTLTPSVVAVDQRSGGLIVGRAAKDILALYPGRAVAAFKRDMGTERTYRIGARTFTPVELTAYVLDALRADAERQLGRLVTRCVITVPAYFNDAQRFATKQAAELAGVAVERVLNEPTAAAIHYGLHQADTEQTFLVFDLGGGTFDVCIMELFEGLLEVRSVAGESHLGGEDFTNQLASLVLQKAGGQRSLEDLPDPASAMTLRRRSEILKRQLSRWPEAEISVPQIEGILSAPVSLRITAAEADAAYEPLLDRMYAPCRTALRGAGLSPADLDEVILVGGATQMPCVRRFAEQVFGRAPITDDEPDRVVVRGAAVQAALCAEDAAVEDVVVTDVLSHSLGVQVVRSVAGRNRDGYFEPIIHRNSVIPTSRTERFSTVSPRQSRIDLLVYEGDARRVEGNQLIGQIRVTGLPKGAPRDVIDVTFSYDLDGILEVEVKALDTKKSICRIFQRRQEELTGPSLENARKRIQALKANPKERPRYRDLLARAELLWSESLSDQRSLLDAAIGDFEEALSTRTPQLMEEAFHRLLSICQRLDSGERW